MRKMNLIRLLLLLLALCTIFTLSACKRDPATDVVDTRLDIVIDRPSGDDPLNDNPTNDDPYINLTSFIPRPERRMPFQPGEVLIEINDPNIKMIEINQCLSYGFDTNSGEYYLMQNFVAGKETAVFISFDEPFDPLSPAVLTIERDGQLVAQLTPSAVVDEYTLLFQPRDISEVGYWVAGAYSFRFEKDNGWAVRTANFYDSTSLKILGVPIVANFGGEVKSCTGRWRDSIEYLIASYPVARANVEFVLHPEIDLSDMKYDLYTDEGADEVWAALCRLQTPGNEYTLIVGYVPDLPYFPSISSYVNGYTGGKPANVVAENNPELMKTLAHEVAHCYNVGDEYEGGSINLDINMPPYGMSGHIIWTWIPVTAKNPLVIGGPQMNLVGPGSVIYEAQRPYYVAGAQLLGNVTSFMGCGARSDAYTRWVSSEIYNHIFQAFVGKIQTSPEDDIFTSGLDEPEPEYWGQCPNCFGDAFDPRFYVDCWQCHEFTQVTGYNFECHNCAGYWSIDNYEDCLYMECSSCNYLIWYDSFIEHNDPTEYDPSRDDAEGGGDGGKSPQGSFTQVTGFLTLDGVFTADPWFTYESSQNVLTPKGLAEYCVYVYDSAGEILASTAFNPEKRRNLDLEDSQIFMDVDRIPINVNVRFPEGAALFTLKRGNTTLYSQTVSQNAPTVAFTGLTPGEQLSDSVRLTWDAYDADGDELFFEIWFYPTFDQGFNVASHISGRSVDINLSELPGTNSGYFHIFATDGVWTTEADSPWVKVPYKAPRLFASDENIPEFKLTESINFDASIHDLQDGWMFGDYFSGLDSPVLWMFEGRVYGYSNILTVWPFELNPGLHTFTCIAKNSAGLETEQDYTFMILDDDSDLPNDWSREDIRGAMGWGLILPLNQLDAPVTRARTAELSSSIYGMFKFLAAGQINPQYENPYPDYEEGVITDATNNADRFYQFLMVYYGVMEAPNGVFNGTGSITQFEHIKVMYKLAAIAIDDPAFMDPSADDDSIVDFIKRLKVFDLNGPNAFEGAERLTNRLAMVRTYRFIENLATRLWEEGYYELPT